MNRRQRHNPSDIERALAGAYSGGHASPTEPESAKSQLAQHLMEAYRAEDDPETKKIILHRLRRLTSRNPFDTEIRNAEREWLQDQTEEALFRWNTLRERAGLPGLREEIEAYLTDDARSAAIWLLHIGDYWWVEFRNDTDFLALAAATIDKTPIGSEAQAREAYRKVKDLLYLQCSMCNDRGYYFNRYEMTDVTCHCQKTNNELDEGAGLNY